MSDPNHSAPVSPGAPGAPGAPAQRDHLTEMDVPLIATVAAVGTILTFVIIVGTVAVWNNQLAAERDSKSLSRTNPALVELKSQQRRKIEGYAWIDPSAKTVAIPIDRAMELLIAERTGSKAGPQAMAPSTQPAQP